MPRGNPNWVKKDAPAAIVAPEPISPGPLEADMAAVATAAANQQALLAEIAALKAKLERRDEIRAEVSDAMRAQQEDDKRKAFGKLTPSAAPVMPPKPEGKLFSVKLARHYAPAGYYEVVGYWKDAVTRKSANGVVVEVEPAEFIPDVMKPPAVAGVGFKTKIWAGTVIRVEEKEAREMRRAGIGELDFD